MDCVGVKIKLIEGGRLPEYKSEGAAGLDCYARLSAIIKPGAWALIELGFALELPTWYEAQVRPRSGLALKHGQIAVFGTVDEDYRGEVTATIFNHSTETFAVRPGDRVAQMVVVPVPRVVLQVSTELSATVRGERGHGSTGV